MVRVQPWKSYPVLVGAVGALKLAPVIKLVAKVAEPPSAAKVTALVFPVHFANTVVAAVIVKVPDPAV